MLDPVTHSDDGENEEELGLADDEATLADDLLDEVGGDEIETEEEVMEGFGILPEAEVEEDEEEEDEEAEEESLEEDAEDVDFDRFDDVDEL